MVPSELLVFGGSASRGLASKLAKELGAEPARAELKRFPDGECYVRLVDDVSGKVVAIVQSMALKPNEYLVEYLLMSETARDLGAEKVVGVIPYLPYARQDARFNPGEALSVKVVAGLLEKAGTELVITVDGHFHRVKNLRDLSRVESVNLTAAPLLARAAVERFGLRDPVVFGPDEESEPMAKAAAEAIGAEYSVLVKKRITATEVEVKPAREVEVRGDALIVDDIISTGGTVAEAAKVLRSLGAKRVFAACTHALLVGNAEERMAAAGVAGVIATDAVEGPRSVVSVAPLVARALKERLKLA